MRDATDWNNIHTKEEHGFLLTRPMRDATGTPHVSKSLATFLLTRPMRDATLWMMIYRSFLKISTHAPHAGRDPVRDEERMISSNFYSRAPCGTRQYEKTPLKSFSHFYSRAPCGTRPKAGGLFFIYYEFLLTRPMRDATTFRYSKYASNAISTHAPHAGRDEEYEQLKEYWTISTHAPHAGRDVLFQNVIRTGNLISTHAPHAGRDGFRNSTAPDPKNFYSRAPCGTRLDIVSSSGSHRISTHAPHAGRDPLLRRLNENSIDFYSRAPCGTRRRT